MRLRYSNRSLSRFCPKTRALFQTNTNDLAAEPDLGPSFPLMTVMSKFIGALKDHFLTMMRNKNQDVDEKTTLWVITVPAIWTEQARSFMRTAALKVCRVLFFFDKG